MLQWAISALAHIWGAALYLLGHPISLHGLIVKYMVSFFGQLEGEQLIYKSAIAAGAVAHDKQPHWAAHFVNAATQEAY